MKCIMNTVILSLQIKLSHINLFWIFIFISYLPVFLSAKHLLKFVNNSNLFPGLDNLKD